MYGDNCQQGPQSSQIDIKLRQRYTHGLFLRKDSVNIKCLSSILLFYLTKNRIVCSRTEVKGVAGRA